MSDFVRRMQEAARAHRTGVPAVPRVPRPPQIDPLLMGPEGRLRERLGLPPLAVAESAATGFQVPEGLMGKVRGLASALEPLALAQDAMFAVIGGAIDPETTITERLRQMKFSDYLPGGDAPERPADGEEIFSLLGFDEGVSKWAGLGADLLVDPLVFGSWLRVTGKLAKVEDLVRLGDKVDTFVSPIGMGREVNSLLRRSQTISAWQDARMERVLRAFRDPNSVVFGIQRFGERSTKALETMLPRDAMLNLRFGQEAGGQLLKAEQAAGASGMRLSREMLELIQRAKYGPAGDTSKKLVQSVVQTMEGQSAAWQRHLSSITDPLERDYIETAVYTIAARQAAKSPQQRASFLTELSPEQIADDTMRKFYEESVEALGRFEEFGLDAETARRLGYDQGDLGQRVIAAAASSVDDEKLVLRERLRGYVEQRTRKAGLSEERVIEEQRRALGVFDEYLKETTFIDARIGFELSGMPFVSERLRSRVFELSNDFEESDRLFKRMLARGLTQGQAGIDELMAESTGISLKNAADELLGDSSKRMERMKVMLAAADDVLERLKKADNIFESRRAGVQARRMEEDAIYRRHHDRLTTLREVSEEQWNARLSSIAAGRRSVLLNGTDDMEEYARIYSSRFRELWKRIENYSAPGGREIKNVKRSLLRNVVSVEDRIERYSAAIAKVANAPAAELNKNLLAEVINEERKLIEAFRRQAALFDETINTIGVKPRPVRVQQASVATEELAGAGDTLYRVRVPKAFYDDHVNRDLPAGRVNKKLARHYEVELSAEEYAELLGDARHYADPGIAADMARNDPMFIGLASSARATVKALEGATPATRQAPGVVRATRTTASELRDPNVTPRSAAAADPDVAEQLFQGPADLYDELTRLRSMADELRLDLEDALTSKVSLPRELEIPTQQVAAQTARLRREVAGHRETIKATRAEQLAARKAEDAVNTTERMRWQAATEAEAIEEGVRKLGGKAHLRKVMERARKEYGIIGRAEPTDAMPRGRNTTKDEIVAARIHQAEKNLGQGEVLDLDEVLSAPVTFQELLGGAADMQALKLGDYLEGIMSGHLRRAFGLFIDENGFNRYVDKLRGGGLITSNVLDEGDLLSNLPGFEREAEMIRAYHNALKAAGGGRVLRRDGIVEYLANEGVSTGRINQVLVALHKSVSGNARHHANIDAIVDHIGRYTAQRTSVQAGIGNEAQALRVRNQTLFDEQVELNNHMLELLGDYSMASMSMLESAQVVNRVLPRQRFFEETLKVATERGLVKGEKFTDRYGAVYRQVGTADGAIGGFGGKFVHPYLYTELQRAAAVKQSLIPAAFTRIRGLITGGYLASPAVLAANVSGGFYQSATAGFNPFVMSKRLIEVLPELRKGARGERSDLLREIDQNLKLDVTTIIGNADVEDVARMVRIEAGIGPEGIRGFLDQGAKRWEDFLQRPFGLRWAGLEGFQFTENWFKVAAYKEAKERFLRDGIPGPNGTRVKIDELRAQELAAEMARTVVFDYSTLPTSLDRLKKTGLVLFPGFPFYLAGRTIQASLERPGTVAMADRLSEAFSNMSLDAQEQAVLYLSSPSYLREDQGVPLPGAMVERADGSRQMSVIPMAQLVPTATIWDSLLTGSAAGAGNPWAESLTQLGMWGPLVDVITALATGEGEDARFTGRYGHMVFEAGASGQEKGAQLFRFLYNTMAPSVVRRGLSIDYQNRAQGLIPSVVRMFMGRGDTPPDDLLAGIYSFEERRTGRPDKGWREGVISSFLRTPQVVALDGPLGGIREEMARERQALNDQLSSLKRRYNRARSAGETATAAELLSRIQGLTDEFNGRWNEYLTFYNDYVRQRKQQQAQ